MKFKFLHKYRLYLHSSEEVNPYPILRLIRKERTTATRPLIDKTYVIKNNYVDFYALHTKAKRVSTWQDVLIVPQRIADSDKSYCIYAGIIEQYPFAGFPDVSLMDCVSKAHFTFEWNKTEPFSVKDYVSKKALTAQDILVLHEVKNLFCGKIIFNPYNDKIEEI